MSYTFVLAPDSFKESMTATEACQAMSAGIRQVLPDANIISVPMADGGEGTVDAVLAARAGEKISLTVMGPLPEQRVMAYFALIDEGKTAVLEMALASGIQLIKPKQRNPLYTTSYGTGELIRAALDHGVQRIIIGLGGSVTNDAGIGMAQALGAHFYDVQGNELALGAGSLSQLAKVELSGLDPRLAHTELIIAGDVSNPLTGAQGASVIYGPQKGATPEQVLYLDSALTHVAQVIEAETGRDYKDLAGAGAAGGLGYALMVLTQAQMRSGVETVIELVQLKQKILGADYVLTGEGAIDQQTLKGKTPLGVAQVAKANRIAVIGCAGRVGDDVDALYQAGFTAIFPIVQQCCTVEEACLRGRENLQRCCENIARLLSIQ